MRFQDLYPNFLDMSESDRVEFFLGYYNRRAIDLTETVVAKVTTQKTRGSGRTDKKLTVTKDQLALLKQLGLC